MSMMSESLIIPSLPGSFNFIFPTFLQSSMVECLLSSESEFVLVARIRLFSPWYDVPSQLTGRKTSSFYLSSIILRRKRQNILQRLNWTKAHNRLLVKVDIYCRGEWLKPLGHFASLAWHKVLLVSPRNVTVVSTQLCASLLPRVTALSPRPLQPWNSLQKHHPTFNLCTNLQCLTNSKHESRYHRW